MAAEHNQANSTGPQTGSTAPRYAVATAMAFVEQHGAPARAVPENLGRAGVRVVLIGADGAFGDVLVNDRDQARAVVEAVANLELSEWDTDTTAALTIGAEHRLAMAGPRARS